MLPPSLHPRVLSVTAAVRRGVLRRRRPLAAVCLAVAVLSGLRSVAPPPPETVAVLTAARDLPAGVVLSSADLEVVRFADGTAPDGRPSRDGAVGRTLAAPMRRGEPLTDRRLVGPGLLSGYPGRVAVPVPVPDPAVLDLLRVGDRVSLLAADPRGGRTEVVAADAPVLALPATGPTPAESAGTGLVVLAVSAQTAEEVTAAAVQRYLAVTISR